MKRVGELLRAEREKRGLSLHEIGMGLKINPKILKAIEDGDTSQLPAKTFLRGFIRSYAQYLRLDVDKVLDLFQEEMGSTRPEEPKTQTGEEVTPAATPPKVERLSKKTEDPSIPQANSGNRIYTIIGALVLLVAIGFVVRMIDKYQKESEVVAVETTPIDDSQVPPPGETEPNMSVATPNSTTTTLLEGAAAVTTSSSSTTSSTMLVASTTTTSSTTTSTTTTRPVTTTTTTTTTRPPTTTTVTTTTRPVTTTTVAAAATVTSSTTTTTRGEGAVEVIVEASSKVSLRYFINPGEWQSIELAPGQVHTFKSKTGVTIEANDGGALSVIVNGRDRGIAGAAGKPVKLSYP